MSCKLGMQIITVQNLDSGHNSMMLSRPDPVRLRDGCGYARLPKMFNILPAGLVIDCSGVNMLKMFPINTLYTQHVISRPVSEN